MSHNDLTLVALSDPTARRQHSLTRLRPLPPLGASADDAAAAAAAAADDADAGAGAAVPEPEPEITSAEIDGLIASVAERLAALPPSDSRASLLSRVDLLRELRASMLPAEFVHASELAPAQLQNYEMVLGKVRDLAREVTVIESAIATKAAELAARRARRHKGPLTPEQMTARHERAVRTSGRLFKALKIWTLFDFLYCVAMTIYPTLTSSFSAFLVYTWAAYVVYWAPAYICHFFLFLSTCVRRRCIMGFSAFLVFFFMLAHGGAIGYVMYYDSSLLTNLTLYIVYLVQVGVFALVEFAFLVALSCYWRRANPAKVLPS